MLSDGSLHWSLLPVNDNTRIPNLLYEVYKSRPDLQAAFPGPFGAKERNLLVWAQNRLGLEYDAGNDLMRKFKLPDEVLNAFMASSYAALLNGFFRWALAPANGTSHLPTLLYEIWKTRPDLQRHFPNPFGYDQNRILVWAQYNLASEYFTMDDFLHRFRIIKDVGDSSDVGAVCVKRGINIVGYIRAEMGIGESSRMAARSIQTTDIPFGMINFEVGMSGSQPRTSDVSWKHKEITWPEHKVNIFHINADYMRTALNVLGPQFFSGHYNIGYWHWEFPQLPDQWYDGFNFVDEVWAPSSFVVDAVSRNSPISTIKIPPGIQIECNPDIDRTYFELPKDRFLFLVMYDIFSTQQRKNPRAAIDAFHKVFGNHPAVGLVLKINNAYENSDEVLEVKLLKQYIQGMNNVYLINRTLARHEVNALIQSVDCFVSLHRSEGFGLVMAEAMYLGKPVIGTNWSGNTDFMNELNACPVNYQIVNVGGNYGPYQIAHQVWAEPDVEHAAHFMQKLVSDDSFRATIAHRGQETIRKDFSPSVVGELTKQRLQSLGLI